MSRLHCSCRRVLVNASTIASTVAWAIVLPAPFAFAADSASFAIRAQLVPTSCDVSLSQSTLDFGTISASTLSDRAATKLPPRDVTVSVACDAAASVALSMTDNRQGSESREMANPTLFGVGMVNNKAVGNFSLATGHSVADGNATDPIARVGAGAWGRFSGSPSGGADYQFSWAPKGGVVPGTYKIIQQTFAVNLEIAPKNNLPPLANGIPIDGSMTFSVVYL